VQCVIRDTALRWPARDYYLIEGARTWTVSDQQMKKEIILQGMGWGHMPGFMIADELRDGRLLSIAGKHLRGGGGEIVAARRREPCSSNTSGEPRSPATRASKVRPGCIVIFSSPAMGRVPMQRRWAAPSLSSHRAILVHKQLSITV
jgi:DNA-binding transcriptional LysR family regulator